MLILKKNLMENPVRTFSVDKCDPIQNWIY